MNKKEFKPGEYVKGIEYFDGDVPIEMRGWVSKKQVPVARPGAEEMLFIQADDIFNGERKTRIALDTAVSCKCINGWEKAVKRTLPMFSKLRHFKGGLYQIIAIANHVDYGRCVVYQDLREPEKIWVRDYAEFMSCVDKEKYPDVKQYYRFEVAE